MEKQVEYYNKVYKSSTTYNLHYLQSPYLPLLVSILSKIPRDVAILELGCGTGQFAKMLHDFGYTDYVGIDFSQVAIQSAKERVPDGTFYCENLFNGLVRELLQAIGLCYICIETLEHIEDDLGLMANMWHGNDIIASVPTFDSESHLRYFTDDRDIIDRYGDLIHLTEITKIDRFFVFTGTIK